MPRRNVERKDPGARVAVAVDKDKGSQYALKWAVDHLMSKGQTITLVHVKTRPSSIPSSSGNYTNISNVNEEFSKAYKQQLEHQAREIFLPFRCFCSRKDITGNEVILEDTDIARALVDYILSAPIEIMVLGTPSKGGFVRRFRSAELTTMVSKAAPDYCTVYVIGKGKISSVRSATASPPSRLDMPPPAQVLLPPPGTIPEAPETPSARSPCLRYRGSGRPQLPLPHLYEDTEMIKSPFSRTRNRFEPSIPESDISFVSSGRPSTDNVFYLGDRPESGSQRFSVSSEFENISLESSLSGNRSMDFSSQHDFSSTSLESGSRASWSSLNMSSQNMDDVEAEMKRLKRELQQTMEMYSAACKEALLAKKRAKELQCWKLQEEQKIEEARLAEEAALSLVEKEKEKCKVAVEAAQAAQMIAELEAQKRMIAEKNVSRVEDEGKLVAASHDVRYRKYTIQDIEAATDLFSPSLKIGEGGYGPVYRCYLDHTPVAIKVLRSDATQGELQFQREVEVLSCIRHPNMVLLLGACPEYCCLVYEYMDNGSLEDRLFRRNNTPVLPWQVRFRMAAEIATGLLFLHQTKPEPIVHRDLKPGNILLDRNYVGKISDVGLARLVPPSVSDSITQYRMTAAVENAIENGTFTDVLDSAVADWPMEETLAFARLALKCSEMRRKDRPDLGRVVLPELDRLRTLAEGNMSSVTNCSSAGTSPNNSQVSTTASDIKDWSY
ncbi:putative LRR receptor-like serine/threonine-protein kinase RLK-like [Hibiscus syriacus]|uniref:LRR receptor-like serine/threonine-protein kinase RLK-like n=1 Tax=Hibiscus syriacus TaxID=106335 RepID=A0A6A3AQZ9_HIBSY|nr:putative LRR receptor-like serine/threonine-protein kinase RLK-like [Hibiscus syriacus]